MRIKHIDPATLVGADYNPRIIDEDQLRALKKSLQRFGFVDPVIVNQQTGRIVGGHQRTRAAVELGFDKVPVVHVDLDEEQEKALNISLNQISGEWDTDELSKLLTELTGDGYDFRDLGFKEEELDALLADLPDALDDLVGGSDQESNQETNEIGEDRQETTTLAERFGIVPFSVLNARAGQWQARKRAWLALGIESEVGRGANLLGMSDTMLEPDPDKRAALGAVYSNPEMIPGFYAKMRSGMTREEIIAEHEASGSKMSNGTSIFDPVLCELVYRWFCPEGGKILDPFAGGSVRGVVASKLGRSYTGIELRAEQVEANRKQGAEICGTKGGPVWKQGDSRDIRKIAKRIKADLLFSCPPYADLEVYSDDPKDLSTLAYDEFLEAYREIIKESCALLKEDRFACFVVGDVRAKNGAYYNFVGDTIEAFRAAGLHYYNEGILVTPAGTLPMRAGRTFAASRKLGKTHQNILVFVKGDGKKATAELGECEFGEFGSEIVDSAGGSERQNVTPLAEESASDESPGKPTEFGIKLRLEDLAGEVS